MASPIPDHPTYDRQISSESGIDNPFRPDGELSREADTIVNLIKEGKPITPIKGEPDEGIPSTDDHTIGVSADQTDTVLQEVKEELISATTANEVETAKVGANGSAPKDHSSPEPGVVEVQHGVVMPAAADSAQVEQVMIKKKPKCKCCVIQ